MRELTDPKIWMSIKDLSLAAKRSVDGFMAGINRSRVKGPGLEFSQYRSYQPGDDLRWLDWKMYARSDRYYIRESEQETSISVQFLIDASDSMNHMDNGYSKLRFAKFMAAALGYLSHIQGDSIGLNIFKSDGVIRLAARKDPQHLKRFFFQLEEMETNGHQRPYRRTFEIVRPGRSGEALPASAFGRSTPAGGHRPRTCSQTQRAAAG